jgi:hypothetical protein
MSAPIPVSAGERLYQVLPEWNLPLDALAGGQAVDELTNLPVSEPLEVEVTVSRVAPAATVDPSVYRSVTARPGVFAIAGRPETTFPDLAVSAYSVAFRVRDPGHLHTSLTVDIPAGTAGFPVPLARPALRRPAVCVRGRINRSGVNPIPLPGVDVSIVDPAGMVGFGAPLAFDHAPGTPVRALHLPAAGPDLELLAEVAEGGAALTLQTRAPAGTVLQLGTGPDREYGVVDALAGPPNPSFAGVVLLRAPLARRRRPGDPVVPILPAAPASSTGLAGGAFAEDQVAFVTDTTQLVAQPTALVDDPNPLRREYVVRWLTSVQSDADGYYRIWPVSRARTVTIRAHDPGPPVAQIDVAQVVSYATAENIVDVRV